MVKTMVLMVKKHGFNGTNHGSNRKNHGFNGKNHDFNGKKHGFNHESEGGLIIVPCIQLDPVHQC